MEKLEIINLALMKCGLPLAASLEDSDWNASTVFAGCLEQLLRGYGWGFAMKYATLEQDLEPPAFGFRYSFILPSDCARVLDVRPGYDLRSPAADYERVQDRLYCNNTPCNLRYVSRGTAINLWPPDFCNALASLIAATIAGLSAEKMNLVPQLLQLHQLDLANAQAADARECRTRLGADNPFQQAREGRQ